MPRGDGTGPGGAGPMTGRAAGYCAGYSMPGFMNPVGGRGYWGWGRGGGRGWRNRFWATGMPGWVRAGYGTGAWGWGPGAYGPWAGGPAQGVTTEQELAGLRQHAEQMQNALGEINNRIQQLEQGSSE